jgi:hypothetical protein
MKWLQADWPAPDFIKAGTTLRQGGESSGAYSSFNLASHVGDEIVAVSQNRSMLNVPNIPQWLEQTHSTKVVLLPNDEAIPKADAAYTQKENTVCAVLTADCLPLLITDEQGSCVAAIHAGWRGLCDGIIENTIKKLPVATQSLLVWLGPAIGADVYEVGEEVYDAFTKDDIEAGRAFVPVPSKAKGIIVTRHWLFDIYALARLRLQRLGITKIYGGDLSTYNDQERFFSYRRQAKTGRMASLIWIEK